MDEDRKPNPAVTRGYEGDDLNLRLLLAFAAGVVGLIVFGALGSIIAFRFFVRHEPLGPPASPFENVRTIPPEPRLQTDAPQDLSRYREAQQKTLNSYGRVDAGAGVVRIPVARAMDILLEKGYPVRSPGQTGGNQQKPATAPPGRREAKAPAPAGAKGAP